MSEQHIKPAEVEGLVERWRHLPYPNTHKMVSHPDGAWVRYHEFAEALTALQAATALTALQAEIEKQRQADEILQGLYEIEQARAEKAEGECDAWKTNAEGLAVALKVTRDDLLSALHSEFDGVWTEADFEEETASADDALAAHAKLKGEV